MTSVSTPCPTTIDVVPEPTDWLTVREAATLLGLTKETVARLGRRGELPIDRPGPRSARIRRSDVDAYIDSCRIEPGTLGTRADDLAAGPGDTDDDSDDDPVGAAT
jgi:excisionase family DNA binding protein